MAKPNIAKRSVSVTRATNTRSRAPYPIGTRSFRTKGEAIEFVRQILNSAPIDQKITGDNAVLLLALLNQHPRAQEPLSRGYAGVAVRWNDFNGAITRGFHVLHPDGRSTPFSYKPCFSAKAGEPSVAAAMRAAIMLSQRAFLVPHFLGRELVPCGLGLVCGGAHVTRAQAHVHHAPPKFRELMAAYVREFGEPKIVSSQGSALGDIFADPIEQQQWVEFHDARAHRMIVCAACNYADERK